MIHSSPKIFISATSSDLGTCRHMIIKALLTLDCTPVEQTHFPLDAGLVREMLHKRIAECQAVIHVAGEIYGAEPKQRSEREPRRSYTQMEYDIARELGKPVYAFICGEGFPYDEHPSEGEEERILQQAHRNRLMAQDQLYHPINSRDELALRVRELQIQVEQLKKVLQKTKDRQKYGFIAVAIAILLVGGVIYQNITEIKKAGDKITAVVENILGAVNENKDASTNIYKTPEYLELKQEVVEAQSDVEQERKNIEKYPDDASFRESLLRKEKKLAESWKKLVDFERDVLKLAEEINKIPLNSERGKKAKEYFEQGNYQAARDILNEKEMSDEKNALLKKRERLRKQEEENKAYLDNLAAEYIFKAKLTAINYQLNEERIPQTRQYFEEALELARTPKYLFEYALFLQQHNQFSDSEKLYQEALTICRELAKANPAVYLSDVAMTLNNLGILVKADSGRRDEAEKLYQEALKTYRELAKANPAVYLPYVANTLGAFGYAYLNWQRPKEALSHLQEATELFTLLASRAPQVFDRKLAITKQLLQLAHDAK